MKKKSQGAEGSGGAEKEREGTSRARAERGTAPGVGWRNGREDGRKEEGQAAQTKKGQTRPREWKKRGIRGAVHSHDAGVAVAASRWMGCCAAKEQQVQCAMEWWKGWGVMEGRRQERGVE